MWARAESAILSTAAVAGVALLARLLFDQRTALIAAAIAAVYPEAIALGAFVLSEAPFAPLMMLNLVCWTLAWKALSQPRVIGWSLGSGVAAGLATLMRPSWLLFVPFAGIIGFVVCEQRRRQVLIVAAMFGSLCLTMLPWWIRNYQVAGRFVPTTLQVGASLYDGLNPTATGASDMRFVGPFVAEQRAADTQPGADTAGLFEDRLDRRMRDAATRWARLNPGRAIQLAGGKLVRMWSFVPNAGEFQSRWIRLALALSYTPVIVLAAIGAWRFIRRDWPCLLCILPAVYLTCLHIIFVSSIRYRGPAMLPLIVLAARALQGFKFQVPRFKLRDQPET